MNFTPPPMLVQWSKQPQNAVDDIPDESPFSDSYAEGYVDRVFNEEITKSALDIRYHEIAGGYLMKGARRGFGGGPEEFTQHTPKELTIRSIRSNIFMFSAAKQYQQVVAMSEFIRQNGLKVPYKEFRQEALNVFGTFNKNWLRTEFSTAVGQAQSARDWIYFDDNKEQFPYLKYHTQEDARVRDEHAILNGIQRKVDDAFWHHYAPKNGWNCRCFLTAHETGRQTDLSKKEIPDFGTAQFPKVFDMNPGVDRLIFDPATHPYFFVERGDAGLKKDNFNLPIPQ